MPAFKPDWIEQPSLQTLLVALPLLLFPFSRLYMAGFLLLLLASFFVVRGGLAALPDLIRWPVAAFAGAILLPLAASLSDPGLSPLHSLQKLLLFLLAGVMAVTVAGLMARPRVAERVALVLSLTILFWLVDGLVQLLFGADLFGQPPSDLHGSPRVVSFFTQYSRYGYYIGLLAAIPVFWLLIDRRQPVAALAVLLLGAVVTMAAGSRYAMLTMLLVMMLFAVVVIRRQPVARRWLLALGSLMTMLLLLLVMYHLSPSFADRYQESLLVLFSADLESLNRGLSYRIDIWRAAVAIALDHPLAGIGPDRMEAYAAAYLAAESHFMVEQVVVMHAHQVLLEVMVATGVIGLLLFLGCYLWLAWRWLCADPARSGVAWAALLVFLLMWLPFGTQKDFYGSEQVLIGFYLLGLASPLFDQRGGG